MSELDKIIALGTLDLAEKAVLDNIPYDLSPALAYVHEAIEKLREKILEGEDAK